MAVSVNIEKNFRDFSLKVQFEGSSAAIGLLGASGSGKSMTLRCIAGIETPDRGKIVINGKTVFDSEAGINLKPQKRQIGYLFQNYALFPTMTVEQNIRCGYRGEKSFAQENGSSRRMASGSPIIILASATRCCCPPESWDGRRFSRPSR